MNNISRKDFLKLGAALPLAMHSLSLRSEEQKKNPPKRIIFINSCLGFYEPYFFPCLLYTSPSPRDVEESRMPSSA